MLISYWPSLRVNSSQFAVWFSCTLRLSVSWGSFWTLPGKGIQTVSKERQREAFSDLDGWLLEHSLAFVSVSV